MGRLVLLILCFSLISSCKNQAQDKGVRHLNYSYSVSNQDANQIGYLKDENTGEVTSISCLYVNDESLLLLDPVHDNIKSIDISTGRLLKVGDKIAGKSVWLSDLIFHEGRYYVASFNNIVYVLDASLKKIAEIDIDNPYGEKRFFLENGKLFICTYSSEFFQTKGFQGYVSASKIDKGDIVSRDTVYMGKGYASFERKYEGYTLTKKDHLVCIGNGINLFCIDKALPKLPYSGKNVFVGKGILSFFEVDEKKLAIDFYIN